MNWYKRANLARQISQIERALLALKYEYPDADIMSASFDEIKSALVNGNHIPEELDPDRFAGMVQFYMKNKEDVENSQITN